MSDIYTALHLSPKKKRCPPEPEDDITLTPKRLRTVPPTPPPTVTRKRPKSSSALPPHLARLHTIQSAVQHALSHALATCGVSPSSDTGIVRNVLNHHSLTTYTGLTTKFDLDDLRRLCWLWEWDGKTLPSSSEADDDDNPFLEPQPPAQPKDWTRGSMGLVLSPTSHYSKTAGKRVPAYGIGIEVEMDIDKDMGGGMAAVARWTAASETRSKEFRGKLDRWVEVHDVVPNVPLADLPPLCVASKSSSLTRRLASLSPKGSSVPSPLVSPPSPTSSPTKSPSKRSAASRAFSIPLSVIPSSLSKSAPGIKNTLAFPQTPSRCNLPDPASSLLTPRTPATSLTSPVSSEPSTPSHQRGANATTAPQTPTSSRRQALYERIRQRSLTASPTKAASSHIIGGKLTRDQMLKMGQEEMRRRCLLGRLSGVAESVWMLFSTPVGSAPLPTTRKRRALPRSEVATAIVKSSPVPISSAEAHESLTILTNLCPFFLKPLEIAGDDWLEMPASSNLAEDSDSKPSAPSSPGPPRSKKETAQELVTRSPRRVKREAGGLRHVREIIRRELELQD